MLSVPSPPNADISPTFDDLPLGPYDRQFRGEVASLVRDILERSYVTQRAETQKAAHQRMITVEEMVAETITFIVMKKVNEEYV